MYRVRQEDLPFQGSSHRFVGADNGDVNVSVFLLSALPGRGPGPHRHPYDEVQFVREGRGLWNVDGKEFEAGAGDILVVKAGEIHSFKCPPPNQRCRSARVSARSSAFANACLSREP